MKTCNFCVLNNSTDSKMSFDENGVCSYCKDALNRKQLVYFPNELGQQKLNSLVTRLKTEGKGKQYDCMMGISGGLDSSYLAYLGYKLGLRILAVHIDDGFDAPIATQNIKNLCEACNIKLITIVPDEEQYNDLTKAFFLAEVPNVAMPQDNILFAELYKYAKKNGVKTFLSGGNFALESILQSSDCSDDGVNAYCVGQIKDIHKKFGTKPIDKLLFMSNSQRIFDRYLCGINSVRPLNFIDYNKERAIAELKEFCDFEYYETKHCENLLTKVIQLYWLPKKFNYDKRTSHLSSLIVSGQMTRQEALEILDKPICDAKQMDKDISFVMQKIGLDRKLFDEIVSRPGKKHSDYKTSFSYYLAHKYFYNFLIKFKG